MANLGTAGFPQVIGNGNVKAVQTSSGYVGGQMVWNVAGTVEYLYMAPFAILTGNTQADQVLQSTVIRVPVPGPQPRCGEIRRPVPERLRLWTSRRQPQRGKSSIWKSGHKPAMDHGGLSEPTNQYFRPAEKSAHPRRLSTYLA